MCYSLALNHSHSFAMKFAEYPIPVGYQMMIHSYGLNNLLVQSYAGFYFHTPGIGALHEGHLPSTTPIL